MFKQHMLDNCVKDEAATLPVCAAIPFGNFPVLHRAEGLDQVESSEVQTVLVTA